MNATESKYSALRELCAADARVRAVLDYAASYPYPTRNVVITVSGLHEILGLPRDSRRARRQLIGALQAIARTGCGRFFAGRHGQPSRLQCDNLSWAALAKAKAPAMTAPTPGVVPPNQASARPPGESKPALTPSEEAAPLARAGETHPMCAHSFRLRRNLVVALRLPDDLTSREGERLAAFVRSLPLADSAEPPAAGT